MFTSTTLRQGYWLLLGLALLLPPQAGAAPAPNMEDFLTPSALASFTLSPNGEHLAYANRLDNDRYVLQVLRLKDKELVGSFGFKGDNDVGDIYWVSDTRLIFGVARKRALSERPIYTNELHAIDLNGKNHKTMVGSHRNALGRKSAGSDWRSWHLVSVDTGDNRTILLSDYVTNKFDADERRRFFKYDVNNGRGFEIGEAPGRFGSGYADSKGDIRLADGVEKNGDRVDYYREKSPGSWTEVGRYRRGESGREVIWFAPDENKLFAYETGADGLRKLVRYEPKTDASELLFSAPGKSVGAVQFDADRRTPLYVETDVFSGLRHWFLRGNPRAEGIQQTLESSPGQRLEIVNFSRNGERAVLRTNSPSNPGVYYIVDFTSGQVLLRHEAAPQLKGKSAGVQQSLEIKARDGLMLPTLLTRPDGLPPKYKSPMIVLVHGGPHDVCDTPEYDAEVQMLASRGYSVMQVNYRGSGCFGEGFQQKGYRQWGAAMQDDITDATRWAISQGLADPQRICIYGASYGGYAALMGAVREPGLYRCAAGNAGVYDLRLMYTVGDIPEDESGKAYLRKVIGTDEVELAARSPAARAAEISIPVMLAHGKDDERAPIEHYQAMADALKKANKPFTSFVRKAEEHGFYSIENRREYWTALLAFFDQNTAAVPR